MTPQQLKSARHALGLSCRELANALSDPDREHRKVHPRTIRRWEAGSQDIPGPAVVAVKLLLALKG